MNDKSHAEAKTPVEPYTPTTEDVRDSYAADIVHVGTYADKVSGFNRWFASEIEKAERRGREGV